MIRIILLASLFITVGCSASLNQQQAAHLDNNFAYVMKKHEQLAERVKKLEDQAMHKASK